MSKTKPESGEKKAECHYLLVYPAQHRLDNPYARTDQNGSKKIRQTWEPNLHGERVTSMKRLLTPLFLMVLVLAACGDTTNEVGTGAQIDAPLPEEPADPNAPIPVEPDGGIGDGSGPIPDDLPISDPADDEVITDNKPVDPKVVTPTEVLINPDDQSELWVRFVGGAAPCTAANVTIITETPDVVEIELVVGITEDALVKSCLAGEFNLRVNVPLNEPATSKSIAWVQAEPAGDEPVLVTPDLSTDDFIGLTEAEAAAIADENIID